ncbi:MAG: S16 family serine protease [Candidatus Micrarchaeota archaeon]
MAKKHRSNHLIYAIIAILLAAAVFTIGMQLGSENAPQKIITKNNCITNQGNNTTVTNAATSALPKFESIEMLLPALTESNEGTTVLLMVEKRDNGTGDVFLNVDDSQPFLANETQYSLKSAVHVARNFNAATRQNFAKSDLFYFININTVEVGGTSAGAAIAIATIALLNGNQLDKNTAITGGVNDNGEITRVGGIMEKAKALKAKGITTLLVPVGESTITRSEVNETETCTEQNLEGSILRSCSTERTLVPKTLNVSVETGINVIEVANVITAYNKMTKH